MKPLLKTWKKKNKMSPNSASVWHAHVWNRIKPVTKVYDCKKHAGRQRKYAVLKPGAWTSVLSSQIARQKRKIPCRWAFKKGSVSEHGRCYITVIGSCITCKATLVGNLNEKPISPIKILKFQFKATNINKDIHNGTKQQKTIRVGGEFAESIYNQKEPASVTRRRMFHETANMFQEPIERILTGQAIRSGKYRLRQLGLLHECPITSLKLLKSTIFNGWIRDIGYDPFHVIYCSTKQVALYKVYKRKNKVVIVSVDATGKVADKIGE